MLLVAGENGIGNERHLMITGDNRAAARDITMRTGEKTGEVVGALTVREQTRSC
jgi:hypothetical protein